uniref:Acetylglutamate kinase n=1 Tax=Titanophycus setchellii TaxID=940129 RepID=A0A1G4NYA5_9FLOR|nr:Acetylglutamate kinase [Titanophycus setchellii]SCW23670.1 Acetylglutamate kinase [Titanophycus setchellii]
MDYSDKLATIEGLHSFMQSIRGKKVVIKYGGAAMKDAKLIEQVIANIILLKDFGLQCIIVHGGGPAINQCLEQLQIQPSFNQGVRVTDSTTMEVVQMVLAGQVNKNIVAMLNKSDAKAVGLSGHDNNFIRALPIDTIENNRVGKIHFINTDIVNLLLDNNYIPVIAPIGVNAMGLSYNINADIVAATLASELQANMLVMLTDTPGILKDCNDLNSVLASLTSTQVTDLIHKGDIFGGMIPKVESCLYALDEGVPVVKIIDGRISNSLLLSLINDIPLGTTIIH